MYSVRRLSAYALIVALLLSAGSVQADLSAYLIPKAFDKAVPENLKDLQDIEQHVKKLPDKLRPSTVGLRIGGSSGSGVIVKDGYVLTAGHVFSYKPDQDVQIVLHDGKIIKGKTLGSNRGIDSGMIKIIDKGEWPAVETATELPKSGSWCMAIGHPNGSQKGRPPVVRLGRVLDADKKGGWMRTDCALVGGDSGGPLFDMYGRVIGIHSRIGLTMTQNIHVPVNTYTETWDRLAKAEVWGDTLFGGKKGKGGPKNAGDPYLGIRIVPDAKDAKVLRIERVVEDSPAAKAGLHVNDILLSIDGKAITTSTEFDKALNAKQPGNVVALEVRRGEEMLSLKVTLTSKRPG